VGSIYLVRHGQASFAAADYDRLSPLGEEQSRLLGRWLLRCGIVADAVVTGGLTRHRATAALCLAEGSHAPQERWLVERGFDEYDHREVLARHRPDLATPDALASTLAASPNPRRAFQQTFAAAVERWVAGGHDGEYAESWTAFCDRVTAAFRALIERSGPSRTVMVFTSGGPIAAVVRGLLSLRDPEALEVNWALVNTGITKVLYDRERAGVSYLNAYPHLEGAASPDLVTYR
jgi:broad specificity phosphatase PhoE